MIQEICEHHEEHAQENHKACAFEDNCSLSNDELRRKIIALEAVMKDMDQVHIEPVHYISNGLYAREIFIPAGVTLTGKIHKTEHINIISKGDISVMTEDGIKRLVAPCTIISKPGMKRVGYAHEDTVWTTIHATELTDIPEIEAALVCDTYEEAGLLPPDETKAIGG